MLGRPGQEKGAKWPDSPEVDAVETAGSGGSSAEAVWTVGGTVTHFGHRHFRQNRYDARVEVVPDAGVWKLRVVEILDEQRLR